MRKSTTLVSALAIAGLALAGSSAFTGGGLTKNASDRFIGGTVTQEITGASVDSVAYTYSDPERTIVDTVTLTFGGDVQDGQLPTIQFYLGVNPIGNYTCGGIASQVSLCTTVVAAADITSVKITLLDANRPLP